MVYLLTPTPASTSGPTPVFHVFDRIEVVVPLIAGVHQDAPPAVVADHLAVVEALISRAGRARPEEVLELVVANNGSP
ncbi:hypothetical protein ACFWG7_28685 [Streptomyces koyangensis]|uniref:hypothetical protein n=1 Tax=Streptomyces koyangensis TaxID=188770 RepID=UPI003370D2B6